MTLARAILVLHALCAMALGGAATHLMLVTLGMLRGEAPKLRLGRIYALTAGILLLVTVGLGLTIYPEFKRSVALPFFDKSAPWAASLFDIKEAAGLIAVPLAVGLILMGRKLESKDGPVLWVFATCAFGLFVLAAFCIVAGLVIVAERGL